MSGVNTGHFKKEIFCGLNATLRTVRKKLSHCPAIPSVLGLLVCSTMSLKTNYLNNLMMTASSGCISSCFVVLITYYKVF